MESEQLLPRIGDWIRESVGLKLSIIGTLILVLLIPSFMISGLISERETRRYTAINEVGSKWGGAQTFAGPMLQVPYRYSWKDEKGISHTEIRNGHFLPETLKINGTVDSEIRYRGIFEVVLYTTTLDVSGTFTPPDFEQLHVGAQDVAWDSAQLAVGISDMKGIRQDVQLNWQQQTLRLNPGIDTGDVLQSAMGTNVPLQPSAQAKGPYEFSFRVVLNGSEQLQFLPLGRSTDVALKGAWTDPSFQGEFLPTSRNVDEKGFESAWHVLDLNRAYPQLWLERSVSLYTSAFGVNLVIPVDGYQQTTRAQKYAILIIGVTFLALFFAELLRGARVHPFQYLLVGLAVCIFYLLLLSLSEHISFNAAYLVAAAAVSVLLSLYSKSVFRSSDLAKTILLYCFGVYGYMFVLLQLNDYALLLGSAGVFCTLATVMYLSGRIRWYPEPVRA